MDRAKEYNIVLTKWPGNGLSAIWLSCIPSRNLTPLPSFLLPASSSRPYVTFENACNLVFYTKVTSSMALGLVTMFIQLQQYLP